jgi:hypothetical protein
LLCARAFSFSVRALGQTHSLPSFGLSVGWWGLAMCVAAMRWHLFLLYYWLHILSLSILILDNHHSILL